MLTIYIPQIGAYVFVDNNRPRPAVYSVRVGEVVRSAIKHNLSEASGALSDEPQTSNLEHLQALFIINATAPVVQYSG